MCVPKCVSVCMSNAFYKNIPTQTIGIGLGLCARVSVGVWLCLGLSCVCLLVYLGICLIVSVCEIDCVAVG